MELEIYAEVKEGNFVNPKHMDRIKTFLSGVNNGYVYLYASKKRSSSSSGQRNYYRGVILKVLKEEGPGYEAEEWHEILKEKFLTREELDEEGNVIGHKILSTESLDTKEREEYHENIRRWASLEFGIIIPDPIKI